MRARHLIFILFAAWALAFAWSFLSAQSIDGPRNVDTGFRRLDVWFRWQMIAFAIAVVMGVIAILQRGLPRGVRLLALSPGTLTLLLVGAFILASRFGIGLPSGDDAAPARPTTAPAEAGDAQP